MQFYTTFKTGMLSTNFQTHFSNIRAFYSSVLKNTENVRLASYFRQRLRSHQRDKLQLAPGSLEVITMALLPCETEIPSLSVR